MINQTSISKDYQSIGDIGIVITDHTGIIPINLEYFNKDTTTDVISFAYDTMPGDEAFSGDIIINLEQAVEEGFKRQGAEYELALYLAHGIDHLSGATDDTPEKRNTMLTRETNWLKQAEKKGILKPLLNSTR